MDNDISKIVSLIMENPQLIDQIKTLADKKDGENAENAEIQDTKALGDTVPAVTYKSEDDGRSRRKKLLYALKPYLSEERARAIDSMMNISDILEIARKH